MEGRFPATVTWTGSTATATYSRACVGAAPDKVEIPLSSGDPTIGDPSRWNPEDLFALSLSTCHMLTFLALAAKARVEVLRYEGHADAILATTGHVTRVGTVVLRPEITLAPGADLERAERMFEAAHRYCYIANAVSCVIEFEPSWVVQAP